MIVGFHTNHLRLRGTEVALFDYAHYNEEFLGNKSVIFARHDGFGAQTDVVKNHPLALAKFESRFPLILYRDPGEIDRLLDANSVDFLYAVKKGTIDDLDPASTPMGVHAVFKFHEPHGDVYAYFSKWLSDTMTAGVAPYVPPMINLPRARTNMRAQLGIPSDAVVFGRYGGFDTFDIPFVHEAVVRCVADYPQVHFLFMHTQNFLEQRKSRLQNLWSRILHKNPARIHFLPGVSSLEEKSRFISSCDAMLHGRKRGETFGVAVGEFSSHNLPVITYGGQGVSGYESAHLQILGPKALVYNDSSELGHHLGEVLKHRDSINKQDWDAYSAEYGMRPVMEKFKDVFLGK